MPHTLLVVEQGRQNFSLNGEVITISVVRPPASTALPAVFGVLVPGRYPSVRRRECADPTGLAQRFVASSFRNLHCSYHDPYRWLALTDRHRLKASKRGRGYRRSYSTGKP